jgi:hypothetical protein
MTRKVLNGRVVVWTIILVGIVVSGVLFYKGTQKKLTASSQDYPIEYKIISMTLPNRETMGNLVIKNETEWKDAIGVSSSIDFSENTVLLISMGQRMTGGFTVQVKTIIEKANKIIAMVEFIAPGKNCITFQAVTYPQLLVMIPQTNKEIEWIITNTIQDCPQ